MKPVPDTAALDRLPALAALGTRASYSVLLVDGRDQRSFGVAPSSLLAPERLRSLASGEGVVSSVPGNDGPLGAGIGFFAGVGLRGSSGEQVGALFVMDPTPRSLAEHEQALLLGLGAQAEALLSPWSVWMAEAMERLNDVIVITEAEPLDEPGPRIVYVNQAFERLTGYPRAEVLGKSPRFLQGPLTSRAALDRIRHALNRGQPVREEIVNYARDGATFVVDLDLTPLTDASGRVSHLIAVQRDVTERRELAEALARSEEQYRQLFNLSPVPMWVYDVETRRFVLVNEAAIREYGYSREEFLMRTIEDVGLADDRPRAPESASPDDQRAVRQRHRHVTRQGAVREVEISASPSTFEGRAARIVTANDVTQEVEGRRSIEASARGLAAAQRLAGIGSFVLDHRTDTFSFSEEAVRLLDVRSASVASHLDAFLERVHPQDRDRVRAALSQGAAGGPGIDLEARLVLASGAVRWIHLLSEPTARRANELVGTMRDITAQHEVESRLREQAALLDQAHDAILVRGLDHRVLYWNKGAERLYGWAPEGARGRLITELLYGAGEAEAGAFEQAQREVLEHDEWMGELRHRTRDGRVVTVACRWSLVRDESGQPTSVLAINTDITEKKQLEQQFMRAQRLESLGTLAAGIAHDLNNLLLPILMTASALRGEASDAALADDLRSIERAAERGAQMVRQLLAFGRGLDEERVLVDPGRVAIEVQKIVHETFPRDIEFSLKLEHAEARLEADPTQLHQLLTNLCVNARDAMPRGGRLSLVVERRNVDDLFAQMHPGLLVGPYVVLAVEDTGEGMPPEVQERLFEPFFTTKSPGQGTGLGLATAQAIVKRHKGVIRVTSTPGRGSRFEVWLPASRAVPGVAAEEAEASVPRDGGGELLLVVDDDAAVVQAAQRSLERKGYRVVTAANGAKAVAVFAQHRDEIAAVLLDMDMPVMDGPTTAFALRAVEPSVRIVATSGLPFEANEGRLAGAGISRFLPKPYSAATLLKVLRETLEPGGHPARRSSPS